MTSPIVSPVVDPVVAPVVDPVIAPVVPPTPVKPPFDITAFMALVTSLQAAMKKGYQTSEFALSAIGMLSAIAFQVFGTDYGLHANAKNISTLVLVLVPIGYSIARAITKSSHNKVVVASINAQAAVLPALVAAGIYSPPAAPAPAPALAPPPASRAARVARSKST